MPREIRIHGVSGTPPGEMLHRDGGGNPERFVSYIDARTGFYRDESVPGIEVYSWGALTSGGGRAREGMKRVGWLALLPFALANVAYWTRPGIEAPGDARRVSAVAVRWAGLLLTMGFVATVCLVSMDLLAWQCFRSGGLVCALPGWASFLDILASPMWNSGPRRLLLAALVPSMVLLTLMWLSGQASRRYESVHDERPGDGPTGMPGLDGGQLILRRAKMWQGQQRLKRQQRLHLVTGFAVVVLYATLPIVQGARAAETSQQRMGLNVLTLAVVLALVAVGSALASMAYSVRDGNDFYGPSPAASKRKADAWALLATLAVAIAGVLMVWANAALLDALPLDEGRNLFGNNLFLGLIFAPLIGIVAFLAFASRSLLAAWLSAAAVIVTTVLGLLLGRAALNDADSIAGTALAASVILLAVYGGRLAQRDLRPGRSDEHAWGGAAPAVILGAATWLAITFSVVAAVGAADVLNGTRPVTAIQSSYGQVPSAAAAALDLQSDSEQWQLAAEGPLVVRDAVVYTGPDGVVVASGTIATQALFTDVRGGASHALPGMTALSASITTDAGSVRIEDSCTAPNRAYAQRIERDLGCTSPDGSATGAIVTRGTVAVPESLEVAGEVQIEVAQPPQETLVVPNVLLWVSTVLPIWLVAVAAVVVFVRVRFARRASEAVAAQVVADGVAEPDRERCGGARATAAFVHRGERLLGLLCVVTVAIALAAAAGAINGEPPWGRFGGLRVLGDIGLYCAMAFGAGLLWVASKVRSSDGARRQAGILWDLATFWPRVAHPFAPPCYGERVVPEITRRVRAALDEHDVVILSGHSQGSAIAVAVASRLSDKQLARIRLVTYGSQLRAWFGRMFPGVLGPDALGTEPLRAAWGFDTAAPDAPAPVGTLPDAPTGSLRQRLSGHGWANLFRRTDPIGFRVFSDSDGADVAVGELDERCDLWTHSAYQFTPEYGAVIEEWTG